MVDTNRDWYSRSSAVGSFDGDDLLEPALVILLMRHHDRIVERDVLDMGVGAGRTTRSLLALTHRYVGIDYSPAMVAHTSKRFPEARIELGDARDLSRFPDGSFDFVLFSYMGIDAVDHEGRLRALRGVHRVLRPGGIFAFSAHNRDFARAHEGPRMAFARNPVTALANVVRWARLSVRHSRMRAREEEHEDYALINDLAEQFLLIHYYVTEPAQRRQLVEAGFHVEEVFDDRGQEVLPGASLRDAAWLWFAASKHAA